MHVTSDHHPADHLPDRPASPQDLQRAAAVAQELTDALRNGYATRVTWRSTSVAPDGHPADLTDQSGVRTDDKHVIALIAEVSNDRWRHRQATLRVDPVGLLLDIFNRRHPGTDVLVEFQPPERMPTPASTPLNDDDGRPDGTGDTPAAGCVRWPEDGRHAPSIWLNTELPMSLIPAVLAEELAHVAAGPDAMHGPAFQAVFDALHHEYDTRARLLHWERWTDPLPISVEDYLAGHPNRRLDVRPRGDGGHVSFIYSEHGWPLSACRVTGSTEADTRAAALAATLHHVAPRLSEDGLRYT